MSRTIYIIIRNVYGIPTLYPACDGAYLACELAGTKTVTPSMVATLSKRGVVVKQAPAQVTELTAKLRAA